MSRARQRLGERGEGAALEFLQKQNYQLLHRNLRRRDGEVDLILRDRDTLVFCEVKTQRFADATLAYSPKQQSRMRRMVLAYLAKSGWEGPVRVDLLAVDGDPAEEGYTLHHFQDILSDNS